MAISYVSTDLFTGCLSFLTPSDLCRASRVSKLLREATWLVLGACTTLSVAGEPPFVTDNGLEYILHRCSSLTDVDIDGRRLTNEGVKAVAAALPHLHAITLRHGYGLTDLTWMQENPATSSSGSKVVKSCSFPCCEERHFLQHEQSGSCGSGSSEGDSLDGQTREHRKKDLEGSQQGITCNDRSANNSLGELSEGSSRLQKRSISLSEVKLRSLSVCDVGHGNASELDDDDRLQLDRDVAWSRFAKAYAPVLRSLTVMSRSNRFLPVNPLAPFFAAHRTPYKTKRYTTDAGPTTGIGVAFAPKAATSSREKKEKVAEEHDKEKAGLVELALATVSVEEMVDVLQKAEILIPRSATDISTSSMSNNPSRPPPLASLRRLILTLNDVTDALCSAIARSCPNLHEVSLRQALFQRQMALTDTGLMALARCSELRVLTLRSDHQHLRGCSDVELVFMTMELKKLQEFNLSGVPRTSDTAAAALLDHPERRLKRLSLEACELLDGHVFIPPILHTSQSTTRLEAIKSLTSISLAHSGNITPDALEALVNACGPCLESLDLSHCLVTDSLLRPILALPGLRDLVLCRCSCITNNGLIEACASRFDASVEKEEAEHEATLPHTVPPSQAPRGQASDASIDTSSVDRACHSSTFPESIFVRGDSSFASLRQTPIVSKPAPTLPNSTLGKDYHHNDRGDGMHEGQEHLGVKAQAQGVAQTRRSRVKSVLESGNSAKRPRNGAPGLPSPPTPPPQRLRMLSLARCEGVGGSGLLELLRSGRLGAHTTALDATDLFTLVDEEVEQLLTGLPRLKELRLSNCVWLTRRCVASIVNSECGQNTLSVLELRGCLDIGNAALNLLAPPAVPALTRLRWLGNDIEAEQRMSCLRGGNCYGIAPCACVRRR